MVGVIDGGFGEIDGVDGIDVRVGALVTLGALVTSERERGMRKAHS